MSHSQGSESRRTRCIAAINDVGGPQNDGADNGDSQDRDDRQPNAGAEPVLLLAVEVQPAGQRQTENHNGKNAAVEGRPRCGLGPHLGYQPVGDDAEQTREEHHIGKGTVQGDRGEVRNGVPGANVVEVAQGVQPSRRRPWQQNQLDRPDGALPEQATQTQARRGGAQHRAEGHGMADDPMTYQAWQHVRFQYAGPTGESKADCDRGDEDRHGGDSGGEACRGFAGGQGGGQAQRHEAQPRQWCHE